MARQDGVMRNISNLVVSVENESFTLMEKALRLLVTAGKGVVEECMPDGDAASADDAASAEAARRILAKLDSEMEEGTKAGAEVLLRAQTLKALIRNGPEFFTQLDDGAVESMGSFSEAVLAGKNFRPVNKASAFLAQDGDKREERIAGFLARPPLKTIADDYGYEVKGEDRAIDDDVAEPLQPHIRQTGYHFTVCGEATDGMPEIITKSQLAPDTDMLAALRHAARRKRQRRG